MPQTHFMKYSFVFIIRQNNTITIICLQMLGWQKRYIVKTLTKLQWLSMLVHTHKLPLQIDNFGINTYSSLSQYHVGCPFDDIMSLYFEYLLRCIIFFTLRRLPHRVSTAPIYNHLYFKAFQNTWWATEHTKEHFWRSVCYVYLHVYICTCWSVIMFLRTNVNKRVSYFTTITSSSFRSPCRV